jgi:integrase
MVLAIIRQIAQWHQTRVEDYTSPVVRGMARCKPAERRRKRILSDDELRAVWSASGKLGVFGSLTRILLLTAQRRTKVATMRRSDIVDGVWTIAVQAREKGTAEKLRLPQMAIDILDAVPAIDGNDFVFPASREGRRDGSGQDFGSYSAFGQGKAALDRLVAQELPDVPQWQLHDLRRTARSLMARADVRPDLAERVLGHAIVGVEAVYDRHSYEAQRAAALEALAALIARILNPPAANVIALTAKR